MTAAVNGRVFDLDAASYVAAEISNSPFPFTHNGEQYTLAPVLAWPANFKAMLAAGDFADLLDAVCDQPDRFWASRPAATFGQLLALFEAWGRWSGSGGSLGESEASPPPASNPT